MGRTPTVPAPQFVQGETVPGLVAEHGFAALVTTRRGDRTHTLLFDTGVSPNGLADNIERLGIDSGGDRGRRAQPRPLRPRRRVPRAGPAAAPAGAADHRAPAGVDRRDAWSFPAGRRGSCRRCAGARSRPRGSRSIERRQPSLLLDGSVLITGEVDRTTDFETGMPFHEAHGDRGGSPIR